MSKGLEALERVRKAHNVASIVMQLSHEDIETIKAIDIIEKELKALEIIHSHLGRMGGVDGTYEGPENTYSIELKNVSPDKYDLLKEVLG